METQTFTGSHVKIGVLMAASELLLTRLRKAGVRPRDLVEWLGVERSTASLMLAGKRGIAIWHLDTLAERLHVEVRDLFTESDLSRTPLIKAQGFRKKGLMSQRQQLRLAFSNTTKLSSIRCRMLRSDSPTRSRNTSPIPRTFIATMRELERVSPKHAAVLGRLAEGIIRSEKGGN